MRDVASAGPESDIRRDSPESNEARVENGREASQSGNDSQEVQASASALADLTILAIRHPVFRNYAIADIDWLIIPPLLTGNFAILHMARPNGSKAPVAAVTWARVSEEVDQRLMENLHRPFRLSPEEYVSGDIYWLAHTFGPPQAVEELIGAVTREAGEDDNGNPIPAGPLAGKKLKQRVRDESGRLMVASVGG